MWNVHVRSSFQEHRFGDGSGTGTWEYFGGYARAASIEDINVLNWPLSVATALEHSSVRDCSERSRAASDPDPHHHLWSLLHLTFILCLFSSYESSTLGMGDVELI